MVELNKVEREYVRGLISAKIEELGQLEEEIPLDPTGQVTRLNVLKARSVLRSALEKL